jgi:hypothetical protein
MKMNSAVDIELDLLILHNVSEFVSQPTGSMVRVTAEEYNLRKWVVIGQLDERTSKQGKEIKHVDVKIT